MSGNERVGGGAFARGNEGVQARQNGGRAPARQNGGGASARQNGGNLAGRGINAGSAQYGARQRPGHAQGGGFFNNFFNRPAPAPVAVLDLGPTHHHHHKTFVTDRGLGDTHDVTVVDCSHSSKAGSIAAIIFGIALTILGGTIAPVDPMAGAIITGIGVITIFTGLASLSCTDRV